jgi:hypothetical protein
MFGNIIQLTILPYVTDKYPSMVAPIYLFNKGYPFNFIITKCGAVHMLKKEQEQLSR